jgi:hypothetical protein
MLADIRLHPIRYSTVSPKDIFKKIFFFEYKIFVPGTKIPFLGQ